MLGLPNADELWFQCDGASIHRSLETVTAMHQLWDRNRVICRSCDRSRNSRPPIEDFAQNWSAHSPDLAPCDQFLYGFMKGKILTIVTLFSPFLKKTHFLSGRIYQHPRPQNLNELRQAIIDAWDAVTPEMLDNAGIHFLSTLEKCIQNNGGHVEH